VICGVDANVLIYSAIESMPEHKRVLSFFERRVRSGKLSCAVSFPVLSEFVHITTDPKRFKPPLTAATLIDHGITSLITCDTDDFKIFTQLQLINPITE
jgi:predicted nucleic acid-binding protein